MLIILEDWTGDTMEYTVDNIKIADSQYKYKIDFGTVYGRGDSLTWHKGTVI